MATAPEPTGPPEPHNCRCSLPQPLWNPDATNDRSVTSSHWGPEGCRCYRTTQAGRDIVIKVGCPVHSAAPAPYRPPEVQPNPLAHARRRIALAGGGAFDGGRYEIPAEMVQLNLYDIGDVEHVYARTDRLTDDGAEVWTYRGHNP